MGLPLILSLAIAAKNEARSWGLSAISSNSCRSFSVSSSYCSVVFLRSAWFAVRCFCASLAVAALARLAASSASFFSLRLAAASAILFLSCGGASTISFFTAADSDTGSASASGAASAAGAASAFAKSLCAEASSASRAALTSA